MKKLLFATAFVASAAAFADPISAISFEGYTAGFQFTNGQAEKDETGTDKQTGPYFLYFGEDDGSSVKAFGGENAAAPNITRPLAFANASPNANYLDLSTEGGILWRSISDTIQEGGTNKLGLAQTVPSDGIYLDTLVQFTPTEDSGNPPDVDALTDKLAIWLNVDSSGASPVTNLMVYAAVVDDSGNPTPTMFTITNKTVNAGEWHRLTVKAIADICEGSGIPAFQIKVDGDVLMSDTRTLSTEFIEYIDGFTYETDIKNGALFASLLGGGVGVTPTLTAVGFKGSGALDDIVWTEEDPFAGAPQPEGYVVDLGGNSVPITLTDAQLAVMADVGGVNTGSVAAVNAALDLEVGGEGATGVKVWEAAVLGLAPTVEGLQEFKIDSVTIGADGKVTVEMADGVTLATGQGIDITLKVIGSDDLTTWDTANPLATVTNSLTIPAMTPAQNETKKFYKVVVQFAATPVQN